ncbi:MAG: GtrA family protein [Mycobacteriales bacterium]
MSAPLTDRLRAVASELGKFVVVGGFCFVLDFVLAYVFRFQAGLGPTTSKTLSTVIATAVSYVGNRLWSFAHRVDADRSQGQDITVYAVINVVGLVITLVPVDVSHYVLGQEGKVAFNVSQLIGTAVATVFRFWAYRRWVFDSAPDAAERSALV